MGFKTEFKVEILLQGTNSRNVPRIMLAFNSNMKRQNQMRYYKAWTSIYNSRNMTVPKKIDIDNITEQFQLEVHI